MNSTKKTYYGWFLLCAAQTPFRYIGLTYLPTLITDQAKYVASRNQEWISWKAPDNVSCGPAYAPYNYTKPETYSDKCIWVPNNPQVIDGINYSSIASYAFTISSVIGIICNIFIVPYADFGSARKIMIYTSSIIYSSSVILTFFISSDNLYLINALLLVLASVSSGIISPISNTYMQNIVADNPEQEKTMNSLSSKGNLVGYFSVAILLPIEFIFFLTEKNSDSDFKSRLALLLVGVFIFILFFISFFLIQNYKLTSRNKNSCPGIHGVKQTLQGLKLLKQFKQIGIFLISQIFINDAMASAGGTVNLVAISDLGITPWQQLISTTMFIGLSIASNFLCYLFIHKGWVTSFHGLIICLIIYSSTMVEQYFFLYNTVQYFVGVALLAISIGGTQSLTRGLLNTYIPKGFEATYNGLMSLTGGATSWICPIINASINNSQNSYRLALIAVIYPFFVIGIIILLFFSSSKAQKEKQEYESKVLLLSSNSETDEISNKN